MHYRRACLSMSAALLLTPALLAAGIAHARDLVVYGEPTLEKALNSVGNLWQARTRTRVNIFVAPTDLSYAQIDRGARCDVIFALAGTATDEALRGKIIQGPISRVLRNSLVLVSTEPGAGRPANATLADLAKLITGKTLAIANPDRDLAGAHAVDLLRQLGIAVDDTNKSVAVAESSAGVVSLLSTGRARVGIVYATDASGFKFVLPLPMLDEPPIEYIVARARDPALDTQPFMTFLTSSEAKAAFRSAGLAPVGDQGVFRRAPAPGPLRVGNRLAAEKASTR